MMSLPFHWLYNIKNPVGWEAGEQSKLYPLDKKVALILDRFTGSGEFFGEIVNIFAELLVSLSEVINRFTGMEYRGMISFTYL